jgi:predicted methyltransferase MtxX (methanogen marker protein 4)
MEQEMDRKVDECNKGRELLRGRKKNAMAKKNRVTQAINSKQQQISIAQQNLQEAEEQIAEVRARGDDQESIDKQMAEWHDAYTRATDMVKASQQAVQEYRKESENIDVRFYHILLFLPCFSWLMCCRAVH